jgi:serine/threonine-protein kinase SRPK3
MIALLGPPPPSLLAQANLRSKFFSVAGKLRATEECSFFSNNAFKGDFCAGIPIPESTPLEHRETSLEGEDRDCFLRFMRRMLQWEPEKRSSARELAEDE